MICFALHFSVFSEYNMLTIDSMNNLWVFSFLFLIFMVPCSQLLCHSSYYSRCQTVSHAVPVSILTILNATERNAWVIWCRPVLIANSAWPSYGILLSWNCFHWNSCKWIETLLWRLCNGPLPFIWYPRLQWNEDLLKFLF